MHPWEVLAVSICTPCLLGACSWVHALRENRVMRSNHDSWEANQDSFRWVDNLTCICEMTWRYRGAAEGDDRGFGVALGGPDGGGFPEARPPTSHVVSPRRRRPPSHFAGVTTQFPLSRSLYSGFQLHFNYIHLHAYPSHLGLRCVAAATFLGVLISRFPHVWRVGLIQ